MVNGMEKEMLWLEMNTFFKTKNNKVQVTVRLPEILLQISIEFPYRSKTTPHLRKNSTSMLHWREQDDDAESDALHCKYANTCNKKNNVVCKVKELQNETGT